MVTFTKIKIGKRSFFIIKNERYAKEKIKILPNNPKTLLNNPVFDFEDRFRVLF